MSVRVTVDIFSGRRNPSWELPETAAHDFLRQVSSRRIVIDDPRQVRDALGYRGVEVALLDDTLGARYALPPSFRIGSRAALDDEASLEIATGLVGLMLDSPSVRATEETETPLTSELQTMVLSEMTRWPEPGYEISSEEELPALEEEPPGPAVACPYDVYAYQPGNWNESGVIRCFNNCYNYATGRRTDNYAQPGYWHYGTLPQQPGSMNCADIGTRIKADGARHASNCFPPSETPRLLIALVIQPGWDFHFYRKHSGGLWAHKPGQKIVRKYDNNGNTIWSPISCARDPYTDWCGYFLTAKSMKVSGSGPPPCV